VSKDAVALARKLDDNLMLAFALFVLARAFVSSGQMDEAIREAAEALELFRRAGDKRGEASTLLLNASIHFERKNLDFANQSASDALQLFRGVKDPQGEALAYQMLQKMERRFVAAAAMPEEQPQAQAEGAASEAASALAKASSAAFDIMSLPLPERVRYTISDLVAQTTGRDNIEDDRTLMETGMTSISSIMLRDRIQDEFPEIEGMDLTFVFDYPTIREMSAFILEALPED